MLELKKKNQYYVGFLFILFLGSCIFSSFITNLIEVDLYSKKYLNDLYYYDLFVSRKDNSELIDSLFTSKVLNYYDKGYFPQIYEPSLQATYYALYILSSIGKLHEINHTAIIEYIMTHYEEASTCFMDNLAFRYLDTDFSQTYFPFNTVLEVTCYAILSLHLLNALDLIDTSDMIDFIWSCQNPSSGGFIGQPYYVGIENGFKIATADNTYFAIITLDLLITDWLGYATQRNSIISFLNRLQIPKESGWASGGFANDESEDFDSLLFHFEPNLLSSYYCIKTLEVFGMISSINEANFHQFLDYLYDPDAHYFRISELDFRTNYTNIVATSFGLELSKITSFANINRNETFSFIQNHRNSLGNWDQSTTVAIHELIDSYQIIRSLYNTDDISLLSTEEVNQIGNATLLYQSYQGFSLLSEDYTSMGLMHAIISSFDLYYKLSELDISQLYTKIKDSYNYNPDEISRNFFGYLIKKNSKIYWFRSFPIEFFTSGQKSYIQEINNFICHQYTYYALDLLEKLFKLDDFANIYDLMDLVEDIASTQFLNNSYYDTFGAFSSFLFYKQNESEYLYNKIYCDYTYYAIRSLEILCDYLSITLADTGIDVTAVYTYIDRNIIETPTMLYYNPKYANDIEIILKTTYFMCYVLKMLNLYTKNSQKIKNYIEAHLTYSDIQNIYYSYKLSELLDLNIEFDFHQIHALVQDIFSEEFNEFRFSTRKKRLNQEIFLWICDMARNSPIGIEIYYSTMCPIGGVNHIEALIYNLILKDFGTYITFKFESSHLGSYIFSKLSNDSYVCDIPIPVSSVSYPIVKGYLRAYEGTKLKAEYYVQFYTNYSLEYDIHFKNDLNNVLFEINASIVANHEYFPTTFGGVYVKVYRNNKYLREIQTTHDDFSSYSIFSFAYTPQTMGDYIFEVYLNDGISGDLLHINTFQYIINDILKNYEDEIQIAIPLLVIFITIPGTMILFSTKKLNKLKKEYEKH